MRRKMMVLSGAAAALALAACGEREVEEAEIVETRETELAQDPLVAPERELDEGVVAGEGGVVEEREIEE